MSTSAASIQARARKRTTTARVRLSLTKAERRRLRKLAPTLSLRAVITAQANHYLRVKARRTLLAAARAGYDWGLDHDDLERLADDQLLTVSAPALDP